MWNGRFDRFLSENRAFFNRIGIGMTPIHSGLECFILTIVSEMTRQGPRTGPDCQTGFKTASCHQFETVLCKENKNRQFFARKMPKTSTFFVNLEYFRFHPFIKLKEKNYPKNTHLSRKSEYTIWSGSTWRFRNSGGVGGVNGRQGGQNCQKPPKKTPK